MKGLWIALLSLMPMTLGAALADARVGEFSALNTLRSENARADVATEEVWAAIKKLNATNYAWKVRTSQGVPARSTPAARAFNAEGKVANAALRYFKGTAVKTSEPRLAGPGMVIAPRPAPPIPSGYEVIFDGDFGFYRPSVAVSAVTNTWRDLEALVRVEAARPEDNRFFKEFVRQVKLSQSPLGTVVLLADHCTFHREAEGPFEAEIPTASLVEFLDLEDAAINLMQPIDGKVRIWVENGFPTKYDITINGQGLPPVAAQPPAGPIQVWTFYRWIEFFDIGTTKIERPTLAPSPAL